MNCVALKHLVCKTWWTLQKPWGKYFYKRNFYVIKGPDTMKEYKWRPEQSAEVFVTIIKIDSCFQQSDRHSHSTSWVEPLSGWLKLSWCCFRGSFRWNNKKWHNTSVIHDNVVFLEWIQAAATQPQSVKQQYNITTKVIYCSEVKSIWNIHIKSASDKRHIHKPVGVNSFSKVE